jgi:mRNA degradation ribonuclease J1/J2
LVGDPGDPASPCLHAFGHESGDELAEFVRTVHPEILIPIHTENPEWWKDALRGSGVEVIVPEYVNGISIE